jgi:CrcB protein
MLVHLALIGIGGFFGTLARYGVAWLTTRWTGIGFPWGTLVVNVTGSFVLGILFAVAIERHMFPAWLRGPLMIGFVGAYTTFSTLVLESWRLLENGMWTQAVINIVGSVALGVGALVLGIAIGRVAA